MGGLVPIPVTSRSPIVVLGGGPAGLGAAWRLALRGFRVTVLERGPKVGGNAGSFELGGQRVDFGSHRLHPSCRRDILADIRALLGDDLLARPRHGRIRLHDRWLHFPLKPLDLARHAPPPFVAGVVRDAALPQWRNGEPETFATVLERGLGRTVCRDFYFPYARKIWGLEPGELDAEQARRRVSAKSIAGLVKKVLPVGRKGFYYYPRGGFGQISDAYAEAARRAGARIETGAAATAVELGEGRVRVTVEDGRSFEADMALSTIPVTALARLVRPAPPPEALEAAASLRYRAMLLIYLTLDVNQYTEFDAHYFPSEQVRVTRVSEPKNYSLAGAKGRTTLCAELPCDPADAVWQAPDEELGRLAAEALETAGLPRPAVAEIAVRRLKQAYPVYAQGYSKDFEKLDSWLGGIDGLVTLGRQGLFVHDNTHHTLAMAYEAADCIGDDGRFDRRRWTESRREFERFVVED